MYIWKAIAMQCLRRAEDLQGFKQYLKGHCNALSDSWRKCLICLFYLEKGRPTNDSGVECNVINILNVTAALGRPSLQSHNLF